MNAIKAKRRQFFTQACHVDIERILVDKALVLPETLKQLLLGHDLIDMLKEKAQYFVLVWRERHLLVSWARKDTILIELIAIQMVL